MDAKRYTPPQSPVADQARPPGRNRWLAAFLALVFPPLGFFYLARAGTALAYLGALVGAISLLFVLGILGAISTDTLFRVVGGVLALAAATHAFLSAAHFQESQLPWYARPAALFGLFVIGTVIPLCVRTYMVEPYRVGSMSTAPTLLPGDHVLVNKLAYGWTLPFIDGRIGPVQTPAPGDLVVFSYPLDQRIAYVQRVVGVPGDRIDYVDKKLQINGRTLAVARGQKVRRDTGEETASDLERASETLGKITHDILIDPSTPTYHPAAVKNFPGKENCTYRDDGLSCTVPAGHYFVMGDSRDQSSDSRYWGFVPEANIRGGAFMIWLSADRARAGTRLQ